MPLKYIRLLAAFVFLLLISCEVLQLKNAGASEIEEYKVKLAFIFNFAKFIDWPSGAFQNASAPIVMCVLGDDPFGAKVTGVEQKMIGDRRFTIKNTRRIEDIDGSQMLFVCASERDRLEQVLRSVKGSSVLTISDIPNFTRIGGIIGFTTSGDKIRFEINLANARAAKLEISSKLLKLAETVRDQ